MATKAAAEESKELAPVSGNTALSADFLDDIVQDAGLGVSNSADDNIIPFLTLLQDLSPEAKSRDPDYVKGAQPGFMLNKASRVFWDTTKAPEDGGDELLVQACAFQRCVNEWIPRDQGGGFIGRHDTLPGEDIKAVLERLGKEVADPRDSSGRKKIWVTEDGHELRDTRYHYVNIQNKDGSLSAAVISFSSSGHTASKEWMTLIKDFKVNVGGKIYQAPSWSKWYRIRSKTKSNTQGEWFVVQVEAGEVIQDKLIRDAGKELNRAFESGLVKAAQEEAPTEGAGASKGDIPI